MKKIKILVTAGDTYELIDDVRKITHMATGRLGSLIADEFTKQGAEVTLICGELSMRPTLEMAKTVEIQGVLELQTAMKTLLAETQFDAVVHSMAVSDYTVRGLTVEEDIAAELGKNIDKLQTTDTKQLQTQLEQSINNAMHNAGGKISSDLPTVVVLLDRAPKVLADVKQIQPNTILVGFKLLSDVTEQELLAAAQKQMQTSGSDFVLANDLAGIEGDNHGSMLINQQGILERMATKPEVAQAIAHHVIKKIGE
jgi:Phosphopantothenoylcysteine synthetase/decarboxylase